MLGFAYRRAEWTKHSWGVDCSVVEDGDVVRVVAHFTAFEAFMDDVLNCLVRDPETGRKLSPAQVSGKPPEGGFLQEVIKNILPIESKSYEWAKEKGCLGYASGVVVKICGD
ncbi:MAG: hypothetical protein QXD59_08140 [Candidatus Caldarchaeum sp.]